MFPAPHYRCILQNTQKKGRLSNPVVAKASLLCQKAARKTPRQAVLQHATDNTIPTTRAHQHGRHAKARVSEVGNRHTDNESPTLHRPVVKLISGLRSTYTLTPSIDFQFRSVRVYVVCNQHMAERPLSIYTFGPSGYTLFAITVYPDALHRFLSPVREGIRCLRSTYALTPSLDSQFRSVWVCLICNQRIP